MSPCFVSLTKPTSAPFAFTSCTLTWFLDEELPPLPYSGAVRTAAASTSVKQRSTALLERMRFGMPDPPFVPDLMRPAHTSLSP